MPRLPPEARAMLRELAAARCFLRPRTFTGLEVAASIARTIGVLIHGLWLASELAESLGDDDDLAAESGWVWQILRRNLRPGTCQATTAGSDVLGLFGGEFLVWNRERTGRTGARQLGIDEIDGFLPERRPPRPWPTSSTRTNSALWSCGARGGVPCTPTDRAPAVRSAGWLTRVSCAADRRAVPRRSPLVAA
jgi:hypothetical protein